MVVLSQSSFYSCFLLLLRHVAAQNNSTIDDSSNEENMSKPTLAFVIVGFSLLGFFIVLRFISIYKQTQTAEIENGRSSSDLRNGESGSGLNMSVIETFPKLFYSTFKKLGIDKEALMCPVCLNEFKEDETVRLIPQCCHVFHPDCVDTWLRSHSTCPVCRANLVHQVSDESVSLLDTPCLPKITIENFRRGCEIQIKVLG